MKRTARLRHAATAALRWTLAAVSGIAVVAAWVPASAVASDGAAPAQVTRIADHPRKHYATADRSDPQVPMLPLAETPLQQWDVRDAREGGVRVVNVATAGCLQISPFGPVVPLVRQAACRDDTYDVWRVVSQSDGSVSLVNAATGHCLAVDLSAPTLELALTAATCTYGTDQRFYLG